jgi:ABC-type lipoprotein export system ATPase subunit
MDAMLAALINADFQWTAHIDSIWRDAHADIPELQRESRQQLEIRLSALRRLRTDESPLGLAILGQGGSGKTHLLSVARKESLAHGHFFVLADMTDIREFWETILVGYIRSLDQKIGNVTQATRLLAKLTAQVKGAPSVDELASARPPRLINRCNLVIEGLGAEHRGEMREHQDVLRALVLLASNDFNIQDRGQQWLQGLPISEDETFRHGFSQSQKRPEQIVRGLSWLMSLVAPTVLALDQLDAIVAEHNLASAVDAGAEPTARQQASLAIIQGLSGGLAALRDLTRSTLTVLSCLEGTWAVLKARTNATVVGRFETPIVLQPVQNAQSIRNLIELRLARTYEENQVKPPYAAYPFGESFFKTRIGLLPREVLKACREHQLACMAAGKVTETGRAETPIVTGDVQRQFDDLVASANVSGMLEREDEEALDKLVEVACEALVQENPLPAHMDALIDKDFAGTGSFEPLHARLRVVDHGANDRERHYAFRFLEKTHHIAFQSRLKAAMTSAGIDQDLEFRRLKVLRAAPRPTGALSVTLMSELEQRGGRLFAPAESELKVLAALHNLLGRRDRLSAQTTAWLRGARPVSNLEMFRDVVEFLFPVTSTPRPPMPPKPERPAKELTGTPKPKTKAATQPPGRDKRRIANEPSEPPPAPRPPTKIHIGTTRALMPLPIDLDTEQLKRHVAVLGGTGSGKTTLALTILEQLLFQGTPVLLIDRKGDLCRYADPELRSGPRVENPLDKLLDKIEVAIFTPGQARGRGLGIALLPPGLEHLDPSERNDAYKDAAAGLGAMLRLKDTPPDQAKQAIIMQALRVLAESGAAGNVSVNSLIELIASEDPTLLEALGHVDPKHCKKLAEHLQTTVHMRGELLAKATDTLSAELLFGMGDHATKGKTRLSIISTKFLGDDAAILFWVSQLLLELNRFASRTPSPALQAAVMFDEADIYLPATSKPPTKPPLESLLKRARSAGISVVLATQSPGDLDYKCRENVRNWFVGLVKEPRALEKLKPLLSESKLDATAVLPKQKVGQFFMLSENAAVPVLAQRNLLETQQMSEPEIVKLANGQSS